MSRWGIFAGICSTVLTFCAPAFAGNTITVGPGGPGGGYDYATIQGGIDAAVNIGYSSGTARFVDQILITPGSFIRSGDSGSLMVTDPGKNPVGLLFASGSGIAVANPIDLVLAAFGVTIDGE